MGLARYSTLVLERLMHYHRFLTESWDPQGERGEAVASREIAKALEIDPTQVRKDLASIGLRGKGRVGFNVRETVDAIRKVLGFDETHLAIVIGAGHLGGALAAYRNFAKYGLRIVAVFDNDPRKVGQELAGCPVREVDAMAGFIERHKIALAIVAVPASAAQDVVDRAVEAGIRGIWNFAPAEITVPQGVCVRTEHISLGLAEMAHHLSHG